MKNIGYLKTSQKDTGEALSGEINTLSVKLAVRLFKRTNKNSDKAPDYTVYGTGQRGNAVNVGAAWIKKGKERQFLSLEIDDPSLPDGLSLLGFKTQDGAYDLRITP